VVQAAQQVELLGGRRDAAGHPHVVRHVAVACGCWRVGLGGHLVRCAQQSAGMMIDASDLRLLLQAVGLGLQP
jgi:hypothetical protein